jgi:8-oxo-dGTP pyrophosphatase MutT (NUDIX family)
VRERSEAPGSGRASAVPAEGEQGAGSVRGMPRPVPPQVIPRPSSWRPGAPAPWAAAPALRRTGIGMQRVLRALDGLGQRGPVPDDVGGDALLGGATIVNESEVPALGHVNAGVLAALFEEDGEARLILTRRSSRLRTHKGEVSFPGGRLNEGEDPAAAARREAHEEVDLDPALVTMVGWLHPVTTLASPALIVPVIAALPGRPHLVASPREVERVFDVALAELADPAIFHEERWQVPGRIIPGSPDNSFAVRFFEVSGELIWGATARMISELITIAVTGQNGL